MVATKPGWDGFIELCCKIQDKQELSNLLDFLFTIEEKEHLTSRILLVRELLRRKKTQREIAKDLNVSIAKITRGSNALKQMPEQVKQLLEDVLL